MHYEPYPQPQNNNTHELTYAGGITLTDLGSRFQDNERTHTTPGGTRWNEADTQGAWVDITGDWHIVQYAPRYPLKSQHVYDSIKQGTQHALTTGIPIGDFPLTPLEELRTRNKAIMQHA